MEHILEVVREVVGDRAEITVDDAFVHVAPHNPRACSVWAGWSQGDELAISLGPYNATTSFFNEPRDALLERLRWALEQVVAGRYSQRVRRGWFASLKVEGRWADGITHRYSEMNGEEGPPRAIVVTFDPY